MNRSKIISILIVTITFLYLSLLCSVEFLNSKQAYVNKEPFSVERIKNTGNLMMQKLNGIWEGVFSWAPLLQNTYVVKAAPQQGRVSDEQLMARAINGEARGEPYIGKVAVGAVIMNRTRAPEFPNTIAGVIYQPGAFTAVSDGQINLPLEANSDAVKAARDAMNGWDPTGGCIYYFNPATATSKWIWSRQIVKTIGKHHFAK